MLDFVSIGAQKTGTTWLQVALSAHPQIRFPAGKEVHFWSRHRARGIEWYRAQFASAPPGCKQGDITPAYAILPIETIRDVRACDPDVRILYTLRNPIERAWSAALMVLTRGDMTVDEASDAWFLDHFRSRGSLMRGDYETCLRNWRDVFPDDQILVQRYETLCHDPLAYLTACCCHIGIDPGCFERERPQILGRRVYEGPRTPLRDSLRGALHEMYAARIESLASYLRADLSTWLEG